MTPAPGGAGITINGMNVPREKAIVILHFGHSNMEGKGEDPASLRPYFYTKVPRLWQYKGNNTFAEAVEPLARRSGTQAGPGMALLKAALASAPSDYHFISIGRGVGSATSVDWSKGGLHYGTFVDMAKQLKGKVTFGAAAIMLGITERHLPASQQNAFPDRLAKIVADLRADLETPDLPIVHTDYEVESTGEFAPTGAVATKFTPMIRSLPSKVQRLEIVPTDGTGMEDDHHFNLEGHKLWADRAIKIVLDKGWNVWTKM
ncbi:MAG TPA: sialate O-acetylesterase [Polyangia bacterium]